MAKNIRWQIPFESIQGVQYRVDIYDEGEFTPVELTAGPTPFVTKEDSSDDVFHPVRSQTGTLQVCTLLPNTTDQYITLDELLPENNIARPVRLINLDTIPATIEWQGFLSCEAYSQDYTGVPQILDLPLISALEAMKSYEMPWNRIAAIGGVTVENFISSLLTRFYNSTSIQVTTYYSEASSDILTKYILQSQYVSYEEDDQNGTFTYIFTASSLYEIFEDICKFMGWCLREVGTTLYFMRVGLDELGMTAVNMSSLQWMGEGHQRTIIQGAKKVSVEASVKGFDTYFKMPQCPITGLNEKNAYADVSAMPVWYYDKCTQATVGMFTSNDISKCFLSRFYGIRQNSQMPWNTIYEDIGFNNAIYLIGQSYTDTSYVKLCKISSMLKFNVICGRRDSIENVGHFVLKIKDQIGATGYMRCGLRFLGRYYKGETGAMWSTSSTETFLVNMSNGSGEIDIEIPRLLTEYTLAESDIELYLYDDFDNGKTSALITDISIEYVPPFKKNTGDANSNKYGQNLSGYRDEINISLNLASSFGNVNSLSLIYGLMEYRYGSDYVYYIEPITSLLYTKANTTTESRRPEVDLLNRLAAYYGAARQRIELEVAHPTAAPLPLLKLNGINDGKVYLPLSESRDWQTDVCKLTCFETPQ